LQCVFDLNTPRDLGRTFRERPVPAEAAVHGTSLHWNPALERPVWWACALAIL
jgi:hypothetical protein